MAFLRANEKKQFLKRGIESTILRLRTLASQLLDLVLPPKCLKCAARVDQSHNICPECFKELYFISEPMCSCCGYPFGFGLGLDYNALGENHCGPCQVRPRSFDQAISVLRYDDQSRNMIIGFKHQDRLEYSNYFVKLLKSVGKDFFAEADLIIPVPLHKRRLLSRRYNQSALLSRILARETGLEHAPELLVRTKNTPPQKGNIKKRTENVTGAFKVNPDYKQAVKNKTILLIDDVYTTGATAENCAKALKKAGASKVYVLTIFRVVSAQNVK